MRLCIVERKVPTLKKTTTGLCLSRCYYSMFRGLDAVQLRHLFETSSSSSLFRSLTRWRRARRCWWGCRWWWRRRRRAWRSWWRVTGRRRWWYRRKWRRRRRARRHWWRVTGRCCWRPGGRACRWHTVSTITTAALLPPPCCWHCTVHAFFLPCHISCFPPCRSWLLTCCTTFQLPRSSCLLAGQVNQGQVRIGPKNAQYFFLSPFYFLPLLKMFTSCIAQLLYLRLKWPV